MSQTCLSAWVRQTAGLSSVLPSFSLFNAFCVLLMYTWDNWGNVQSAVPRYCPARSGSFILWSFQYAFVSNLVSKQHYSVIYTRTVTARLVFNDKHGAKKTPLFLFKTSMSFPSRLNTVWYCCLAVAFIVSRTMETLTASLDKYQTCGSTTALMCPCSVLISHIKEWQRKKLNLWRFN